MALVFYIVRSNVVNHKHTVYLILIFRFLCCSVHCSDVGCVVILYNFCWAAEKIVTWYFCHVVISGNWKQSCWMWREKGPNVAVETIVSVVVAGAWSPSVYWVFSLSLFSVRCATTMCAANAKRYSPMDPGCAACVPKSRKNCFVHC